MAKASQTRIFKAKTTAEAVTKAKSVMGPNIVVVSHRQISESNLFSKLKLGGEALSVELEVALDDAEPEAEAKAKKPAAPVTGAFLANSYAKALEGKEKFGPNAVQAMTASAAPFASVGETNAGVMKFIEEARKELAASRRESAENWERVRMLVSLQARGGVPAVSPVFLDCYRGLVAADVREELARDIVEKLQRDIPGEGDADLVGEALLKEVARRIPVAGALLPSENRPTVIALVGASGVGKTTSVVKLAFQFAMRQGKSVAVVNEDIRRPGADSQINNLGRLFGIHVATASEPKEIADAVRSLSGKDLVLLDTGGRSPRDKREIARLAEIVRSAGADETHLLLSGVTAEKDMRRAIDAYAPAGFDRVILTKLDECASPGIALNIGAELACGFSYVTTGPDYNRPIEPADQDFLAELVLGRREIAPSGDAEFREGCGA